MFKPVTIDCPDLVRQLRETTKRLRFVSESTGSPLGYFIPIEAIESNRTLNDFGETVALNDALIPSNGDIPEPLEFVSSEGTVLGVFVPETEREIRAYESAYAAFAPDVLEAAIARGGAYSFDEMWSRILNGRTIP